MLHETLMLYKLVILYILNRVDFPMTNSQITNFILENDYTDYFNVQQTLGELIDDGYVYREAIRNSTLYRLSDSGRETLELLKDTLSSGLCEDIDKYIKENKYRLREEISVLADYYEVKPGIYNAHLYIDEAQSRIFEITMQATSAEEADLICGNWKKKSSELYANAVELLMNQPASK